MTVCRTNVTPAQRAVLLLRARGHSARETWEALGISEEAYWSRHLRLLDNLHAIDLTHALAVAVARGVVRVEEL